MPVLSSDLWTSEEARFDAGAVCLEECLADKGALMDGWQRAQHCPVELQKPHC